MKLTVVYFKTMVGFECISVLFGYYLSVQKRLKLEEVV